MEYTKISDTKFKASESKVEEKEYNIVDLKNDRAIYVAEIAQYQAKVDAVDVLLAKADELGVVEAEVAVGEDIIK